MKKSTPAEKEERLRIRRLSKRQTAQELRLMPGRQTHEQLWQITIKLPTDYEPYGQMARENFGDCSCGCRWYHMLAGRRGEDWGVCANPTSPRAGLLTLEHQGCLQFKPDPRSDFLDTANGRKAHQNFEDGEEELRQRRRAPPLL